MKYKALRFLPLAFLAGTHGFALFAPYAAVVLAALHVRNVRRDRARARERDAAIDRSDAGMQTEAVAALA